MVRGAIWVMAFVMAAAAMMPSAEAADARRGERLAQGHCATCHIVTPQARQEIADAPPFPVIARKYNFDANAIKFAISGPHPKMNFMPDPTEAEDIAAYIATLGK